MRRSRVGHWAVACVLVLSVGCAGGRGKGASGRSAASGDAEAPSPAAEVAGLSAAAVPEEGDAVAVRVRAARDLNTFNELPHTLVLALYQVSQSSAFSQLLETPEGREKLLEGEAFDPSVLARRRIVVQPGETQVLVMDRVEGARYLAAAAGYYEARPEDTARLVQVEERSGGLWPWRHPVPFVVDLHLGRNGFAP